MKKEIKKYTVVCDICEQELFDSGVRTNCGKFEEPYFKAHKIDLCYTCAGKLFATQIGNKISEEKLQEMVSKTRGILGKTTDNQESIELDLDNMFKVHPESELKIDVPKEIEAPALNLDFASSETNLKTLEDL